VGVKSKEISLKGTTQSVGGVEEQVSIKRILNHLRYKKKKTDDS
jgi:hypothetical protein